MTDLVSSLALGRLDTSIGGRGGGGGSGGGGSVIRPHNIRSIVRSQIAAYTSKTIIRGGIAANIPRDNDVRETEEAP